MPFLPFYSLRRSLVVDHIPHEVLDDRHQLEVNLYDADPKVRNFDKLAAIVDFYRYASTTQDEDLV